MLIPNSIYDYTAKGIDGKDVSLSTYKGKVVIIVNVASKCGFTPQYKDLQAFYDKFKSRDLVILGFPANNFMGQEPGSDKEIQEFCSSKFGVSFPMFSKIEVKGSAIHPLYQYLTAKKLNGSFDAPVTWNFQKFLIDKNGKVIKSFAPSSSVWDPEFIKEVEVLLSK